MYSGIRTADRPANETPLSVWLHSKGMSHYALAQQMKVDPRSVYFWASNKALPTLLYAILIERATEGGVPIVAWEGTELARLKLRTMGMDWEGWEERRAEERARNGPRRKERYRG